MGNSGFVFGVDIQPITALPFTNVRTMIGDITKPEIIDEIRKDAGPSFDVVLSDLAPNVSGVWDIDHARQIELARCAVRVGGMLLQVSGSMLVKVFQGSEVVEFRDHMRSLFDEFRIVKPQASRAESAELYFLGLGFVGESAK